MEVDELKKEERIRNISNKIDELIMERVSLLFPEKDEKGKEALFLKTTNLLKKLCIDSFYDPESSSSKEEHGACVMMAAMSLLEMVFHSSSNITRKDVEILLNVISKNFSDRENE